MCAHCKELRTDVLPVGGTERASGADFIVFACAAHAHRYLHLDQVWQMRQRHVAACRTCKPARPCRTGLILQQAHDAARAAASENGR
ncbi:hypothetical protein [Streptomyces sp. YIM 98790]|uniref:hypothetical protein n=1 Tax=Streptomyces sp. YIM 98790 TaxID=2689077 RepID=UPI00140D3959|nr:hypothetical protein [Streptomyces sp. YIM 98790]